ncbi:DNA-3-methyladenine glycosylase [Fructilactobacillus ixorae]|uniref:Putative 3-methyladenine DNA glycosylase n=1 Tax=Fructilactobacillus ixorae TaxID=1750535 RepID=A0ABY5C3V4_9LACO|nr:DNA-3-methyladenine glycosylase [Fructilactobacillus ixorae]USS93457.1 DNA-3-methyladenine glycosylase [Fructilactobacillus ixorae]
MTERLRRFFATGTTDEITQRLLGKLLVYHSPHGLMSGYITEAEAYLGQRDSAAHAYQGKRTPANEALYGVPGTIYIYSIHSRLCLDVATQAEEVPEGILIRGLEPVAGRAVMEQHRAKHGYELTNGPGKLMEALGITDKQLNEREFGETALDIDLEHGKTPQKIMASGRIGVSDRGSWTNQPYRFYVAGNPYVSKLPKRDFDLQKHGWLPD